MTPSEPEPNIVRPPGPLDRLLIPASVLQTTLYGLSLGRDREMLCYWLGAVLPPDARGRTRGMVTTAAFPRIESGYAAFRLLEGQMGQITDWCAANDVWVLAQVHTHPTDEPHSEADECWPASHRKGFLSIVIPFFAQFATLREPQWRLHQLVGDGRWLDAEPEERLEVIADVWVPNGR